ncbi:MAG TPA: hypothetical protein VG892_00850 [Terriglobales bacterium]|nr:hypothetical protein [Terriglobales bacterium]
MTSIGVLLVVMSGGVLFLLRFLLALSQELKQIRPVNHDLEAESMIPLVLRLNSAGMRVRSAQSAAAGWLL